ncbi:FAD-binding oxidoreductase [Kribbella sp. NPDC026611]|uniref:FAD-binding oxidoreductase n=1 Tax=Kribbella sp. NPDC026611 TaxID=3154911 RepID=UPI0033C385C1
MELIGPDHQLYDALRRPAFSRYDEIRPAAIARCTSAEDVAEVLDTKLQVVPRGGGHCFAGRSSTTGLLLDLSTMNAVSPDGRRVTIGAGARLEHVYRSLHAHGLTIPAGCGPTVGIAGLTLGGGLGLIGRSYGLTCDRLIEATVVLADGRILTTSSTDHPELFWALRGAGGGQFGVVTSLVFDAVLSPAATRFDVVWPRSRAADVITAWQAWAPDAPDDLTACLTVTPTEVRVFGAALGAVDLGPLDGEVQLRDGLSWPDLKRSLNEPEGPDEIFSKSEFFSHDLPAEAIADLLTTGATLSFTPMGGAYNRVAPDATAFPHRRERFLLEHTSPDPATARSSWRIAHPHASGRVYANFPDPDLTDWATAYHGENYSRLTAVKDRYDPGNLFHFPQSIEGATR